VGVLFSLETISFDEQKLFSFMRSHLSMLRQHLLIVSSHGRKGKAALRTSVVTAFMKTPSSRPQNLIMSQKVAANNRTTMVIRLQCMNVGGHTYSDHGSLRDGMTEQKGMGHIDVNDF
jgi:hypothetical protein